MLLTVADPLLPPVQDTSRLVAMDAVGPVELVTVTVAFSVQPRLSVTVTLYEPAERLEADDPLPPDGDH
jgi:hypothetical protein